jgi:NAD(P)-dependent dehydrogenase (short-subunit alcohol dehydrogenase family)
VSAVASGTGDALRDRVALVTGASYGIGRAIAIGLAAAGARVALLARSERELADAVGEIESDGGVATAIVADLARGDQVADAVRRVRAELGAPTVLINNAGIGTPLGPTPGLEASMVAPAIALNVVAPITLTVALLPGMLAAGWGRIVNISSGVARMHTALPGMTVYTASKAALEAHTANLAAELDGTGVTANVYWPGEVDTPMQRWMRNQPAEQIGESLHAAFVAMYERGLISPEHSARSLLARLSGDESGELWVVDLPER